MANKKNTSPKKTSNKTTMIKIAETIGQVAGEISVKKDQIANIAAKAIKKVKRTIGSSSVAGKKVKKKTAAVPVKKSAPTATANTASRKTLAKVPRKPAGKNKGLTGTASKPAPKTKTVPPAKPSQKNSGSSTAKSAAAKPGNNTKKAGPLQAQKSTGKSNVGKQEKTGAMKPAKGGKTQQQQIQPPEKNPSGGIPRPSSVIIKKKRSLQAPQSPSNQKGESNKAR